VDESSTATAEPEPVVAPKRTPVLLVRLCALAVLPVVVATVMAIAGGYTPVGDSATLALRAGDVTRGSPPLTGMPTTADRLADEEWIDHPGPLEVWVAALPYRILGPVGLLLTVAVVNAASLIVAVRVGWRQGGPPLAIGMTGLGLVLCWSLGTEVLRDPLNTHVTLLPWFAALVLTWEVAVGRWRSLPLAIAAVSWSVQAHVVWILPAAVLVIGGAWLAVRQELARPPAQREARAGNRRRSLQRAAIVGVVLNLPLLIDQAFGNGNLGRMVAFGGEAGLGLGHAVRATVVAFGIPPAWLRTEMDPFLLLRSPTLLDLLGFAAVVAGAALLLQRTDRPSHRRADRLLQVAGLATAGAALAVARTPEGGAVAAADAMLLWRPVTAVAWLALGWGAWIRARQRVQERSQAEATPILATSTQRHVATTVAVIAALSLVAATALAPPRRESFGAALREPASMIGPPTVDAMAGERLVQVNADGWASRLYLRHAVIEQLERAGIATMTAEPERAFRRHQEDDAKPSATVWVISGATGALPPDPRAVLVGTAQIVPGGARAEEADRRRAIRAILDDAGRVRLASSDDLTLDEVSEEYFRWDEPPPAGNADLPASWVSVDAYVDLARNGLVVSPRIDRSLVDQVHRDGIGRYFAAEDTTVAVYVRTS
jgi:hypothetical protein